MTFSRTTAILFFVLLFISCQKNVEAESKQGQVEIYEPTIEASLDKTIEPSKNSGRVPVLARTFDVHAKMKSFNKLQEEKVYLAIDLIKKVISSAEFRRKVLNKKYNGKKQFVDNKGLTNLQIYNKILQGAEKLNDFGKNNVMDLELELYFEENITIGYTYPNISTIYMNKKYFNKFKPHQVADNVFHEWLHKIGFAHSVENNDRRPHSVPYAVGYIVKALARKYQ